jgi:hypothetical protein
LAQASYTPFDSDGAIAVQLNFVGPVRTLWKLGDEGTFHWLDEVSFSL